MFVYVLVVFLKLFAICLGYYFFVEENSLLLNWIKFLWPEGQRLEVLLKSYSRKLVTAQMGGISWRC